MNSWKGCHEIVCQYWKRRFPDHDQEYHAMANDGVEFVRFVSDARVMGYRDPTAPADHLQPVFIGASGREVVMVSFDR